MSIGSVRTGSGSKVRPSMKARKPYDYAFEAGQAPTPLGIPSAPSLAAASGSQLVDHVVTVKAAAAPSSGSNEPAEHVLGVPVTG